MRLPGDKNRPEGQFDLFEDKTDAAPKAAAGRRSTAKTARNVKDSVKNKAEVLNTGTEPTGGTRFEVLRDIVHVVGSDAEAHQWLNKIEELLNTRQYPSFSMMQACIQLSADPRNHYRDSEAADVPTPFTADQTGMDPNRLEQILKHCNRQHVTQRVIVNVTPDSIPASTSDEADAIKAAESHDEEARSQVVEVIEFELAIPLMVSGECLGALACVGRGDIDHCESILDVVGQLIALRLRRDRADKGMADSLNDILVAHELLSGGKLDLVSSEGNKDAYDQRAPQDFGDSGSLSDSSKDSSDEHSLTHAHAHGEELDVGSVTRSASAERYQRMYQETPTVFLVLDAAGVIQHASRYALESLGYQLEELVGNSASTVYANVNEEDIVARMSACLALPDDIHRHECEIQHADGTWLRVRETARIAKVPGDENVILIVLQDVTDSYRRSRELEYRATHDALTGLVNREEFERRLEQAIRAVSLDGANHTLCYIDLDYFKDINDTSGHGAGDEFLKGLARLFESHMRQSDTVARLGGDEFAVLMEFCTLENAERLADELRVAVENFEFEWKGRQLPASVSIGLTTIDRDDDTVTEAMARADAACYLAKGAGRNRIAVNRSSSVGSDNSRESRRRLAIEEALENDGFEVHVQSAIPAQQLTPVGRHEHILHELLIRLSVDGVRQSAGEFLPTVNRCGLTVEVDRWVINRACELLSERRTFTNDIFSINLSAATLSDPDFIEFLIGKLGVHGINPTTLCFECSESVVTTSRTSIKYQIQEIRGLGSRFAIDSFGSGYSSFNLVRDLEVDYLKIDRSLIDNLDTSAVDRAIFKSVINVAQSIGAATVAGFVEREHQLQAVRELGVAYVQGQLIGITRPLDVIAITDSRGRHIASG